ncbi:MAG: polysaccharide pyruvyl transferase family protein [Defluviitaleaceae bacterium]|nr:polysaccharide pyruvyl transferase family protein [Defluviitaleaceae bacterium]
MKRFLFYAHPGTYNHGAQAIAKTTICMIREKYGNKAHIAVSSHFPEQDRQFGLDADEFFSVNHQVWGEEKTAVSWEEKEDVARKMYADALSSITPDTVLLSVGGDNYCYDNWHRLAVFQQAAASKNAKSILWGCSIEPAAITPKMVDVLNTYTHILPRETKTLEALNNHGIKSDVHLIPDPAFRLEPKATNIPKGFDEGNAVGINLGPLVIRREKKAGIIKDNIAELIDYVLSKTDMPIILIPHVVMPVDNDLNTLKELLATIPDRWQYRVWLVDESICAAKRKFIISKCRFLVCSRTHASIAAYSSGVPTIVLGYSIKSVGIGKDLGMDRFVVDIDNIDKNGIICETFKELMTNEKEIRSSLTKKVIECKKQTSKYFDFI